MSSMSSKTNAAIKLLKTLQKTLDDYVKTESEKYIKTILIN